MHQNLKLNKMTVYVLLPIFLGVPFILVHFLLGNAIHVTEASVFYVSYLLRAFALSRYSSDLILTFLVFFP